MSSPAVGPRAQRRPLDVDVDPRAPSALGGRKVQLRQTVGALAHAAGSSVTPERRLVQFADEACGGTGRGFQLCETMQIDLDVEGLRPSTLNDDGSPIEVSITSTSSGCRFRLIGDPCPEERRPDARLRAFCEALRGLLALGGAEALGAAAADAICEWLPEDHRRLERVTSRILWLAAGIDCPGIGFYLDGRVEDTLGQCWARGREWLGRMLPDPSLARRYMAAFEPVGGLGGVGMEGVSPDLARVKFQCGLVRAARVDELGLPLVDHDALRRFFHIMVGEKDFTPAIPIFSAGFSLLSGDVVDIKADLCGCRHCLDLSPEEWADRIQTSCEAFDLALPPALSELLDGTCQGVYLGLGIDVDVELRLILYLKG